MRINEAQLEQKLALQKSRTCLKFQEKNKLRVGMRARKKNARLLRLPQLLKKENESLTRCICMGEVVQRLLKKDREQLRRRA